MTRACGLYDSRPFGNSTGVERSGNREEKVPCSLGICVGLAAASSVPKSERTSIGNRRKQAEENPPARRLTTAKKEEDFSANRSKKIQRKKIQFQTGSFDPLPFHRWQITGAATLREHRVPVRVESHRERLLAIKGGAVPWAEVDAWRRELHEDFERALSETKLPDRPDYERANEFLLKARRQTAG
ncbi:MAG TPA: hypothetical protein VJA21_10955 [Verrucomicrobiae bacterium]